LLFRYTILYSKRGVGGRGSTSKSSEKRTGEEQMAGGRGRDDPAAPTAPTCYVLPSGASVPAARARARTHAYTRRVAGDDAVSAGARQCHRRPDSGESCCVRASSTSVRAPRVRGPRCSRCRRRRRAQNADHVPRRDGSVRRRR